MTLASGARLGCYEILSALGAGGMGEVYRARDTKLGRHVAIKVLPEAFAADPDRMARFQREAHVLASLNHPRIASIYGLEESDSVRALVMELVEGPTLHERIAQGAILIEEALPIAKQIAEALEYAHEHGIVHRDLKPANVKLTKDGDVKVLDFGLAKALSDDPLSPEVSHSPTLSAVATRAGIILGTAAYMSPEQAKGKQADRRSDIWSFGVVLYEMLTGQRLYSSDTAAETLALVLTKEPDFGALPERAPSRVRELLRRCLTKDPKQRLQAIGEARIAIEDTLAHPEAQAPPGGSGRESGAQRAAPVWGRALPWAIAVAVAVLATWAPWRPAPQPPVPLRLNVELGAGLSFAGVGPAAILSPDGAVLAFVARTAAIDRRQLYVRRLDQLQASPLSGTEGADRPFFSPDGQWLGFFADRKLKKIAVTGGAAVTLCDAPSSRGGSWSEDGTIFLARNSREGLWRVSSAGGSPEPLTSLDPAAREITHRWPQALPGGKAVLFTAHSAGGDFDDADVVVQRLPDGPRKIVQRGGFHGRYLGSGHVVYVHRGTLFAAPFDLERLEPAGEPAPVLEDVASIPVTGDAYFAFSARGTLAYLRGQSFESKVSIQWMDREGKTQPLRALPAFYNDVRFSPDGRMLAMDIGEGSQFDVWVYAWGRDTMSRLTSDAGEDAGPVWTPDARRIAFASARGDKATPNLYWQRPDGTGEAERLTESKNRQLPTSWHPTGRFLAYNEINPQTSGDIMILPMEGDEASGWKPGKPTVFLNSPFSEGGAAFSPDGRWLAYSSADTRRAEVYVRPFPGPGGKWQVSTGGGNLPTWSLNRKELFYRATEETLMVAPYAAEGDSFRAEKPRQWSPGRVPPGEQGTRTFDLHPDGQRFAVLKAAEQQAEVNKVILILNFFDELRRVAPAAKP